MKDDLIRRGDALGALNKQQMITKSVMRRAVMKVPAVDAVEVVRCGECIRAVNEWISASAPPKDHKEYIVMIKGATCPTTLWYRPNQKTWNVASDDKNYIVTHWMHMPEPPKGE